MEPIWESNRISMEAAQRRAFARMKAHMHVSEIPDEERAREVWLGYFLDQCLSEYEKGLEKLCDHLQHQAEDAVALMSPRPIIVEQK